MCVVAWKRCLLADVGAPTVRTRRCGAVEAGKFRSETVIWSDANTAVRSGDAGTVSRCNGVALRQRRQRRGNRGRLAGRVSDPVRPTVMRLLAERHADGERHEIRRATALTDADVAALDEEVQRTGAQRKAGARGVRELGHGGIP